MKIKNQSIYLIKSGEPNHRALMVSTPTECFRVKSVYKGVIFTDKNTFTSEQGRTLVKVYVEEGVSKFAGILGAYTLKAMQEPRNYNTIMCTDFETALAEHYGLAISKYAKALLDALHDDRKEIIELVTNTSSVI